MYKIKYIEYKCAQINRITKQLQFYQNDVSDKII